MKKPIILIGGGGHCRSCIEVIESEGVFEIVGILDDPKKIGSGILGFPVIGADNIISSLIEQGHYFLITIGQVKHSQKRKDLYLQLKEKGARLATVIAPTAIVSKYAAICDGTIIMHKAIVNAGAAIGNNVILNTSCLVEHDVKVQDHVHVSTHTVLNGGVTVDENCFIGSNAVVVQDVSITKNVTIGAGAVITKNITHAGIYVGNPGKELIK